MKHLLKLGGLTPQEILHFLDVATSAPSAAARPLRTLSARVSPPSTTQQGLGQAAAIRSHSGRLAPATSTTCRTAGCAARAAQLVSSTVRPSGRR